MPRPKKIKSPEDFGKEFEKLKKPRKKVCEELKKYDNQMGKTDLSDLPETKFEKAIKEAIEEGTALEELQEYAEKCEKYPLENLQKLEKKLRACTTENPTVITYGFTGDKTSLYMEFFDHIKVVADISSVKMFCLESKKPYLVTAQKMLDVLKEWRGE